MIFEIIDKTERKIRLTKRQWKHIMKRHSYMQKYLEEIKETNDILRTLKCAVSQRILGFGGGGAERWWAGQINDRNLKVADFFLVKFPDKIINAQLNKCYYYKNCKYLKSPNNFILVVVKYLNGEGFVITTYQTNKIK